MDAKTLGAKPVLSHIFDDGMTLRQLYAGMAMQGLISHPQTFALYKKLPLEEGVANDAVVFADALLAELAKEESNG